MRGSSRGLVACCCSRLRIKPNLLWRRGATTKRNNQQPIVVAHQKTAAAASNFQCSFLQNQSTERKHNHVPKRIVFGSCSSQTLDLSYWERIFAIAPDLVIIMGDNVYGKEEGGVEVQTSSYCGGNFCVTSNVRCWTSLRSAPTYFFRVHNQIKKPSKF